jgi:hypothetical protein
MINLIYIGDKFYHESKTFMSSIYKVNYERYDYGFLQRDLEIGEEIHIRQANPSELKYFESRLKELLKRKEII